MKMRLAFGLLVLLLTIGITLPTAPEQIVADIGTDLYEDFEGTVSGWTATGFWHIEDNSTSLYPIVGIPSNSHYAWYGNSTSGNYHTTDTSGNTTANSGELISDSFSLTSFTDNVFLEFYSWADTEFGDSFDLKEIYISPNGGLNWTQVGNIVTNSAPTEWDLVVFDISDWVSYSNVKIKFSFDTVDDVSNLGRGWLIDNIAIVSTPSEGWLDLWIYQETSAMVGEKRWMDFFVESYFNYTDTGYFEIIIYRPDTYTDVLFNQNISLSAYGSWNISLDYTFPMPGSYNVVFSISDFSGKYWETTCDWEIYEKEGGFDLWIDQENFAVIGQYKNMWFNVESFFSHNMTVDLYIEITDPYGVTNLLYHNDMEYMQANSLWTMSHGYSFSYVGDYQIHLYLYDDKDSYWDTWCWWLVFEKSSEFLYLDIHQEFHAYVGDTKHMGLAVYSNFSYAFTDVSLYAEITTPSYGNKTLYYDGSTTIYPQEWYYQDVYFTFEETGYYDVYLYITLPTGEQWIAHCWWEIHSPLGDVELWIEQKTEAYVGEEVLMSFLAKNHRPDPIQVWFDITIDLDGQMIYNISFSDIWIGPGEMWKYDLPFIFNEVGYYTVYFNTEEVGKPENQWYADCFWDVYGEYLEVSFEYDELVVVNESEVFYIKIVNNFETIMHFEVNITLYDETGYGIQVLSESVNGVPPGASWMGKFDHTFTESGKYELQAEIYYEGSLIYKTMKFEVLSEAPPTTTTDSDTTPVLTPGFEGLVLLLAVLPLVHSRKRR